MTYNVFSGTLNLTQPTIHTGELALAAVKLLLPKVLGVHGTTLVCDRSLLSVIVSKYSVLQLNVV